MGTCPGAIADHTRHRRSQQLASTHEYGLAGRGIEPLHPGYEPDQSTVTVPRDVKLYPIGYKTHEINRKDTDRV